MGSHESEVSHSSQFVFFTFVKWFMHEHDNACVTLGMEWGCMGMVALKRVVN